MTDDRIAAKLDEFGDAMHAAVFQEPAFAAAAIVGTIGVPRPVGALS